MGYKLFLLFEKFLMALPKALRKNFFIFLGTLAYYISNKYRKTSFTNLDFIFGDTLTYEEKKDITQYAFKNLSLNFLHAMELRHMSKEELAQRITIENIEAIERVHASGRPIIYATAHYSSWELGGASIGAFIEPLIAVYKKMRNPTYQDWLLEARGKFGNISMEKTNVLKPLIKNLKKGMACGILIDTNMKKKEGLVVEFLGKQVSHTATASFLARKFNAAIIPVTMRTDDEYNYTLKIYDEIEVQRTEDEEDDILQATQAQAAWLSQLIYTEPKFWFWLHRRFKSDYPEIYEN
jgi:KDO2-lipid IV(A) lauroyltransferase